MGDEPTPVPRPATIYDVAQAAGVSASTVSRAFSRPGRVSSRTAQRIHAVATELGYRSEELYRAPTSMRHHVIGLAVGDITNPAFFPIIRGAEHACARAGYTLLLGDAQESDAREREFFERAVPHVDGLVIASSRVSDTDLRGLARRVPLVVLNRDVLGLPCVTPDNARGTRRAIEHLAELGHRGIAYVSGPEASWADGSRWRAVREAAMELGLDEHRLGPVSPTTVGGESVADEIRRRGYRAVLAYNDMVAIGVMRGLARAGASVPHDVSVVGFDNTFASDLVTPGLTTVASPLVSLGEVAINNVVALVGGATPQRTDGAIVVPTRLIVRGSTAPPA